MPDAEDFAQRLRAIAPDAFPDGLRPAQAHVLDRYAELGSDVTDIGIELPTGEGKTLIAVHAGLEDGVRQCRVDGAPGPPHGQRVRKAPHHGER